VIGLFIDVVIVKGTW